MTQRRYKLIAVALLALTTCAAAYWAWDHRGYWIVDNFRAVEPGRIYAAAYQYPIPLKRLIDRYQIKTVLSLREGGDSFEEIERRAVQSKGATFQTVVIPYGVGYEERMARIDQAIAQMTDPNNQPVLVHCWAGCHRTGAVVAIYRVSRCGWTEQAAADEMVRWGGKSHGAKWPTKILRAYCQQQRESMASGSAATTEPIRR